MLAQTTNYCNLIPETESRRTLSTRCLLTCWNVTYMRIEHVALWTSDLDRSKEFYTKFFGASSCPKYVNPIKKLEAFFLSFDSGARLEIMRKPNLASCPNDNQTSGWTHVALVVGTTEAVDRKAASLQKKVG